jgi:hypothetical protein
MIIRLTCVDGEQGERGSASPGHREGLSPPQQLAPDGGFQGGDGRSDLYYTVFGLEASLALNADIPCDASPTTGSLCAGKSLTCASAWPGANLYELAARPWTPARAASFAAVQSLMADSTRPPMRARQCVRSFRPGTFQDLGIARSRDGIAASVQSPQMPDGGYANEGT